MHEIIASPFLGGHLLVRPGRRNGIKIPRQHYAELSTAQICPAWLVSAARQAWQIDLSARPVTGTILVRPESAFGYGRASYEVNLGCNYDCEHCYLGLKRFDGLTWPDRERLLEILRDAGVLWLQLTGGCLCARRVPYRSCLIYSGSSEQKKSCPDLTAGEELRAHACAWRKSWLALRAACGEVSMSR